MTGGLRVGLTLGVLLAALVPFRSWGQVQIIRELPQTGENQAQADWHPPLPSQQAPSPERGVQFGGRVSIGASGGVNDSGAQTFDTLLASNLSLLVPAGGSSGFLLSSNASRTPRLDGLDQAYKGGVKLTFDTWQAEVAGGWVDHESSQPGSSSSDSTGDAHAALTLGIIPTLPISATYSYQRLTQAQSDSTGASSQTRNEGQHQAQLKATGTLGTVGVDSGASFSSVTDDAQNSQTTGFGGNVGVTVPLASFVKVYATLVPRYDATTYSQTGNNATNTSLESDAGFIFPLSDSFSFRVGAARIDQWSAQSGPSANTDPTVLPYSVTWKGTAGVEVKQQTGISASSNYGFGKTVGGPYINSLDANVAWHGQKDDALKEAAVGGSDSISVDDSAAVVNNQASWKASLQFGDQGALAGGASYVGSADGISQVSLTNTAHANISHQVTPQISYALAGDLSSSQGPDIQSTLIQSSQAKLTVAPKFGDRVVTFTADDTLALDLMASPSTIVSKAGAGVSVPLLSFLTTRYRFDWEWDSLPFAGAAAADSNFRNALGVTLSGQGLPFTLSTEYALSFGFRGLRHDGTLSVSAALWKGFAVEGSLAVGEYDLNGAPAYPFLASLNGSYSF